jgi:inner membrane protein
MDSLTQIALGATVSVAVMGRRTAAWKAAAWGAVAGTLPDLDAFVDHGDAILDMVLHRAETHAPFWLSLFSLPLGMAVARLSGEWRHWQRWWLAMWVALVTHPLLDAMTVYGTQLGLPFTDYPYGVGSIFIIDLLYTVPLMVGVVWAMAARGSPRGLRANAIGLGLSTLYLAWSVVAQQHVAQVARESLAAQGLAAERLLVTPTPFNTIVWRVVAVSGADYREGFYGLRDPERRITAWDRFDSGAPLLADLVRVDGVRRIVAFTRGFYRLQVNGDSARITDLRMGQEPSYTFSFEVARRAPALPPPAGGSAGAVDAAGVSGAGGTPGLVARSDAAPGPWRAAPGSPNVGGRGDLGAALAWLWRRMQGEVAPPPR